MNLCEDCRFFHKRPDIEETKEGTCRMHPPVAYKPDGHEVFGWPIVYGDEEACGDYKDKGAEMIE